MFIPNILAQELTKSADKYWNTSLLKIQKLQTKLLPCYSWGLNKRGGPNKRAIWKIANFKRGGPNKRVGWKTQTL